MPTYQEWRKKNWDRAHQNQDLSALTGTGLGGHLNTLCTKDLFCSTSNVLAIGVGTGSWVKELSQCAKNIWALDVSKLAKKNLPQFVSFACLPEALPESYFDLAMSLWVAPHMTDFDLADQLYWVIRSLKESTGVLAIHYKEPLDQNQTFDNREGADDEYRITTAAMIMRRRKHFEEIVRRAGGYVDKYALECPTQFFQVNEVSAHIKKLPR